MDELIGVDRSDRSPVPDRPVVCLGVDAAELRLEEEMAEDDDFHNPQWKDESEPEPEERHEDEDEAEEESDGDGSLFPPVSPERGPGDRPRMSEDDDFWSIGPSAVPRRRR